VYFPIFGKAQLAISTWCGSENYYAEELDVMTGLAVLLTLEVLVLVLVLRKDDVASGKKSRRCPEHKAY
jgi:hypothetical protein